MFNIVKLCLFITVSFAILSGCSSKLHPTDTCKYPLSISDMNFAGDFDAVEFFDLAIEVSKDHNFAPPMFYDKNERLLVFGNEDVDTMPGLKMVTYMWIPDSSSESIQTVCINKQILDVKGSSLNEFSSHKIIEDYSQDLSKQYFEKKENLSRLMQKFNYNQ